MAPDEQILKRKRSRPSQWWAAVPSPNQSATSVAPVSHPAKKNKSTETSRPTTYESSAKTVSEVTSKDPEDVEVQSTPPNTGREVEGNSSKSVSSAQSLNSTAQNIRRLEDVSADNEDHSELRSGKRKRAGPTAWWAANSAKERAEELNGPMTTKGNEGSKGGHQQSTNTSQTSTVIDLSAEDVLSTAESAEPLVDSSSERQPSRRKRVPPPEWWAVNTSTPSKEATPWKKGNKTQVKKPSTGVLKDVTSRGNMVKQPKPTESGDVFEKHPKARGTQRGRGQAAASVQSKTKVVKHQRGTPPKVLDKAPTPLRRGRSSRNEAEIQAAAMSSSSLASCVEHGDAGMSEPHHTSSIESNGRSENQLESEEILEVQTATSNFGRGKARTGGHVEPAHQSRTIQKAPNSKGQRAQTKSNKAPVKSKHVSKSTHREPEQASGLRNSRNPKKAVETTQPSSENAQVGRADSPIDETPQFQHLAAVKRRVSRATIEEKWEELPPNCVELINQMLVNSQRTVVVRLGNQDRRAQADTALQTISRKLLKKVSKGLPFPRAVGRQREDDFDFEKIIDRNQRLEGQLNSELDANKLLDESLTKELALLESEREILADLETNAKTQSSQRKAGSAKLHPFLQSASSPEVDGIEVSSSLGARAMPSLGFSTDENLQMVVRDLEGHVDSLQGNFKPLSALPEAMAKAKAAVQITILDHLGSTKCEEVVLGL